MEDIMWKKPCISTSSPSACPPAMHKDSQTISKVVKPKIRIIHIFAPEIIKADVANFRELVQRLTGKPSDDHNNHEDGCYNKLKKKQARRSRREKEGLDHDPTINTNNDIKKVEIRNGFGVLGSRDHNNHHVYQRSVKEEEEMMWNGANSGGFLGGFADLDGLIQELGVAEFPHMLPAAMDHANHHMHGLEEVNLLNDQININGIFCFPFKMLDYSSFLSFLNIGFN